MGEQTPVFSDASNGSVKRSVKLSKVRSVGLMGQNLTNFFLHFFGTNMILPDEGSVTSQISYYTKSDRITYSLANNIPKFTNPSQQRLYVANAHNFLIFCRKLMEKGGFSEKISINDADLEINFISKHVFYDFLAFFIQSHEKIADLDDINAMKERKKAYLEKHKDISDNFFELAFEIKKGEIAQNIASPLSMDALKVRFINNYLGYCPRNSLKDIAAIMKMEDKALGDKLEITLH